MRMKSILALSAFTVATFIGGVTYAADADKISKKPDQNADQADQAEQKATVTKKVKKHKHKHRNKHKHKHHHHHRHDVTHRAYFVDSPSVRNNNFLIGATLGYLSQKENFITTYTAPTLPVSIPIYVSHSEKNTDGGMIMGLLAGWQYHFHRWLFGVEGSYDYQGFDKSHQFTYTEGNAPTAAVNNFATGTMLYDRGDIFGLTGRVGYFVTPGFMPYLRLGIQMSRDEVEYQSFIGTATVTSGRTGTQTIFPDYSSKTKDVYGVVAGIGAELPTFIGASTIRVEYNFVRTESVIIEDNTFPIIGNHKFRYPESHMGKVSWVWNFM